MKNIYSLTNRFSVLKEGVYHFRYYQSNLQFIASFIFPIIFFVVAYFFSESFVKHLLNDIPFKTWSINLYSIDYYIENNHGYTTGSFNYIFPFCIFYLGVAILFRIIMFRNKKNYTLTFNKPQQLLNIKTIQKSINIPLAQFSYFDIAIENEWNSGKKSTIYILQLHKKDFGKYELFRTNNKARVNEIFDQLSSDLKFDEFENLTPENNKIKTIFLDRNPDKIKFHQKVKWYFWSNWTVVATILISINVYFLNDLNFDFKNLDGVTKGVVIYHILLYLVISGLIIWVMYYVFKVSVNKARFKYELLFNSDGIEFYKISKSLGKEMMQKTLYTDILHVLQMPIKTDLFSSNAALGIISKQDEDNFKKTSDCFTSKLTHSIGFHLDQEDFIDAIAVEYFIEKKILEKSGIQVL